MKNLYILIGMLFLYSQGLAQQTTEKQWSYSVGLGMVVTPSYLGDDESRLLVFPNFSVAYGDKFFASLLDGASYNLIKTNTWRIGPVLKSNIGRLEDGTLPSSVSGSKTSDLIGLGDIDPTLEPGFFIEYTKSSITSKIEFRQGIGGHRGLLGELRSEYRNTFRIKTKSIYYSIGPEVRISGSNFNNAFFGVDKEQSLNTDLPVYETKLGLLSYGLTGSLVVPINERLSAIAFFRYTKLGDVASDSHLIRAHGSPNQSTLAFMINYKL